MNELKKFVLGTTAWLTPLIFMAIFIAVAIDIAANTWLTDSITFK